MENDDDGEIQHGGSRKDPCSAMGYTEGSGRRETSQPSACEEGMADREEEAEFLRRKREIEFDRRERELMRRELELARREIAALRQGTYATQEEESRAQGAHERQNNVAAMSRPLSGMNLKAIAELVSEFDGTPDKFELSGKNR